eukprot:TRINITY_DN43932_c0_g1_i2.p1 TRINITY_DN43932_c0_g1~~TRINITY_DN43932_c0_g1_i2.p1  ORF type:complete len:104 (+),score=8.23 TRINITY_DN43932_c0_g1_i2:50-361(+)
MHITGIGIVSSAVFSVVQPGLALKDAVVQSQSHDAEWHGGWHDRHFLIKLSDQCPSWHIRGWDDGIMNQNRQWHTVGRVVHCGYIFSDIPYSLHVWLVSHCGE